MLQNGQSFSSSPAGGAKSEFGRAIPERLHEAASDAVLLRRPAAAPPPLLHHRRLHPTPLRIHAPGQEESREK